MAEEKPEKCPECGDRGPFLTVPRLVEAEEGHIFEIGYRCVKCGHEWGFKRA